MDEAAAKKKLQKLQKKKLHAIMNLVTCGNSNCHINQANRTVVSIYIKQIPKGLGSVRH